MKEWFAVAVGGMLGALLRHVISVGFAFIHPSWLPIATLTANMVGCFAIGMLAEWSHLQSVTREWWVVGARVGLLGGLTTYSAFALDVVRLWHEHRNWQSAAFVACHVIFGVVAVVLGVQLARAMQAAEVTTSGS